MKAFVHGNWFLPGVLIVLLILWCPATGGAIEESEKTPGSSENTKSLQFDFPLPVPGNLIKSPSKWNVWDDPESEDSIKSKWKIGIAELSSIYHDEDKIPAILLAGDENWENYSIKTSILVTGRMNCFSGLICGYQDKDHYYAVGYNFEEWRFEIRIIEPSGKKILAQKEQDAFNKDTSWRVDFVNGQIRLALDGKLLLDVKDGTYKSGSFGLCTHGMGNAQFLFGPVTVSALTPGTLPGEKVLFREDFSHGDLRKWKIRDDPKATDGPSKWTIVLSEFSGIFNETSGRPATILYTGKQSMSNYSFSADYYLYGTDGYLTGLVFGLQDVENYYVAGFNSDWERWELALIYNNQYNLLNFFDVDDTDIFYKKKTPIKVGFSGKRIVFIVNDRVIFDLENNRFKKGMIGIATSDAGDGEILLNNFKLSPFESKPFPKKGIEDILSYGHGASVIYFDTLSDSSEFLYLIDHSLTDNSDMGNEFELDLQTDQLPKEVVFSFPLGRFAEIHKICFKLGEEHFPKEVRFEVSDITPKSGFRPLANLILKPNKNSFQEFDVPHVTAKYLKMSIVSSVNKDYLSIPEIFVKGYLKSHITGNPEKDILKKAKIIETEPNDTYENARELPFKTFLGGTAKKKDIDYFKLDLRNHNEIKLALSIKSNGILRPGFQVLSTNKEVMAPDFTRSIGSIQTIEYTLKPDLYFLRIKKPESYIVIVYDDSGSMGDSIPILKKVLTGFLNNIGSELNLKLIKYTDEAIELSDFVNDPDLLKAALEKHVGEGGGTDAFVGLSAAIKSLQGRKGNRVIWAVFDDLDGDGDDIENYIDLWNNLLKSGISLTTMGIQTQSKLWHERLPDYLGNSQHTIFSEMAYASGGHFFLAPSEKTIEHTAKTIFTQLTSPLKYLVNAELKEIKKEPEEKKQGIVQVLFEKEVEKETEKNIELILDASNSMWGQLNGKSKIQIAREVLAKLVKGLPDDINAGLRVYGHRYNIKDKRACTDTELIVPISKLDRDKMIRFADGITPKGKTPLVYSILQTPGDFKEAGKGAVILVSDGIESCDGDIKTVADTLKASRLDLKVHIVGFSIKEMEEKKQLKAIAKSTGGRYLDAKDSKELLSSLEKALQIVYLVLDKNGKIVARGYAGGEEIKAAEGEYTIRIMVEDPIEQKVFISPNKNQIFFLKRENNKWIIKGK